MECFIVSQGVAIGLGYAALSERIREYSANFQLFNV